MLLLDATTLLSASSLAANSLRLFSVSQESLVLDMQGAARPRLPLRKPRSSDMRSPSCSLPMKDSKKCIQQEICDYSRSTKISQTFSPLHSTATAGRLLSRNLCAGRHRYRHYSELLVGVSAWARVRVFNLRDALTASRRKPYYFFE